LLEGSIPVPADFKRKCRRGERIGRSYRKHRLCKVCLDPLARISGCPRRKQVFRIGDVTAPVEGESKHENRHWLSVSISVAQRSAQAADCVIKPDTPLRHEREPDFHSRCAPLGAMKHRNPRLELPIRLDGFIPMAGPG
jgi:hypothetical protein